MLTLRSLVLAAMALVFVPTQVRAEPARYAIDAEHVSVGFLVEHVGYAKTLGMFRGVTGEYRYDAATGVLADLRIEIDAASVYTAHDKRDEHLRGRDFLDVARFPKLVYTATTATRRGERDYVITATVNKRAPYPFALSPLQRAPVMGVSASGSFRRSEFGMMYAVENGWVGDEVALIIELEAREQ
jgi:polyisoprenoid-binding protein YceI